MVKGGFSETLRHILDKTRKWKPNKQCWTKPWFRETETFWFRWFRRNIRTKPFWKKAETETYERNHFGKKPKPKHTNETILKKSRTKPICFGGFGIYILMIVGIDINYSLCLPLLCNTLLKEEEYTSFTRGDSQMKTHSKAIFQILHTYTHPRPSRTYVENFWVHSLAPQVRFFLTEATWLLKTRPACKTNFASLVLPSPRSWLHLWTTLEKWCVHH